jgi:hypothetical protein
MRNSADATAVVDLTWLSKQGDAEKSTLCLSITQSGVLIPGYAPRTDRDWYGHLVASAMPK